MNTKKTNRITKTRGIPRNQYQILARLVRQGKTTWEELEKEGLVSAAGRKSDFRRKVERRLGI